MQFCTAVSLRLMAFETEETFLPESERAENFLCFYEKRYLPSSISINSILHRFLAKGASFITFYLHKAVKLVLKYDKKGLVYVLFPYRFPISFETLFTEALPNPK